MKNKNLILFSNSCWNIYNFRRSLINDLEKKGFVVTIIAPKDNFTFKLQALGYKVLILNLSQYSFSLNEFFSIIRLFFIFYRLKPSVILSFTIKPNIYCSLVNLFFNFKLINVVTGTGHLFRNSNISKFSKFFIFFNGYIFNRVHLFVFQNISDKNLYYNCFNLKNKYVLIEGSGVNTFYFQKDFNINKDDNITTFLFPGRLLLEKGIFEYLEVAKFFKNNKNLRFYIVGNLLDEKFYIDNNYFFNCLKENSNIIFLGYSMDIINIYSKIDCVILPSYSEGTSKSLLEAASMEIPIITSNIPGCNNVVRNNYNGFLSDVNDVQGLISSINLFLNLDFNERKLFGSRGREIVLNSFSESVINKKYLEIIFN